MSQTATSPTKTHSNELTQQQNNLSSSIPYQVRPLSQQWVASESQLNQMRSHYPSLTPLDVAWHCDRDMLSKSMQAYIQSHSTEEDDAPFSLKPLFPLNQPKALEALNLGLEIESPGYHIFVTGPDGCGKTSSIKRVLARLERMHTSQYDLLYLYNFQDSDRPILYRLMRGEGQKVKRAIQRFVERLPECIVSALNADRVERKRRHYRKALGSLYQSVIQEFQKSCQEQGFTLTFEEEDDVATFEIEVLIKRKKSLPLDEWIEAMQKGKVRAISDDKVHQMIENHQIFEQQLQILWDELSTQEWEIKRQIFDYELKQVKSNLLHETHILSPYYDDQDPNNLLYQWLNGVMEWIADHLEEFKMVKDEPIDFKDVRQLKVNVIHEASEKTPIVFEQAPTLINLLGTIEKSGDDTHHTLDFADIRSGSLLKANGGILVINANDLTRESGTWRHLLRVLRSRSLVIQSPDQLFSSGGGPLKPAAIPLDVKVIAIGNDEIYRALYMNSDDFARVFKIKVEFDDSINNQIEHIQFYVDHAYLVCHEEGFKKCDVEALALWIEHTTRLSGRQDRLSTRLGLLTDILREAAFYAQQDEKCLWITSTHMQKALQQRHARHQLIEEQLLTMMYNQLIEIDTRI